MKVAKDKAKSTKGKVLAMKKKGSGKAAEENHTRAFRNLRCDHESCAFLVKVPDDQLSLGKLRCPIHKSVLKTREERGETRGRYVAAAS